MLVTLQEQSGCSDPSQREAEEDDTGVKGV